MLVVILTIAVMRPTNAADTFAAEPPEYGSITNDEQQINHNDMGFYINLVVDVEGYRTEEQSIDTHVTEEQVNEEHTTEEQVNEVDQESGRLNEVNQAPEQIYEVDQAQEQANENYQASEQANENYQASEQATENYQASEQAIENYQASEQAIENYQASEQANENYQAQEQANENYQAQEQATGELVASFTRQEWVLGASADTSCLSFQYVRRLTMNASAYTAGPCCTGKGPGHPLYGITASGRHVEHGIVAVDPSVIPLGTRLYVDGYGFALAADTGSAIRGYKIDLFMYDLTDARQFGRRDITVFVLE